MIISKREVDLLLLWELLEIYSLVYSLQLLCPDVLLELFPQADTIITEIMIAEIMIAEIIIIILTEKNQLLLSSNNSHHHEDEKICHMTMANINIGQDGFTGEVVLKISPDE